MRVAVLAHIFWEDSWDTMKGYFFNLKESQGVEPIFIINTCLEAVADKIRQDLPEAHILVSENGGFDIGGIFIALDFYLKHKLHSDFMIITHDKKSSPEDFKYLMTILHKDVVPIVLKHFERKSVGMVGAKYNLLEHIGYISFDLMQHYCDRFGLPNLQKGSKDAKYYCFVAGTIFWVRSIVFERFFSLNNPLELRVDTLEDYKLSCDFNRTACAFERIFGYITTNDGYSIIGWEDKMLRVLHG